MDNMENKYEIVESNPDNNTKYKTTRKKARRHGRRKRMSGGLKALIVIVLVIALLAGGSAFFINSYLSKVNYGDSVGEVDPEIVEAEQIEFDGQKKADEDLLKNDSSVWYDSRIYNILLVGVDYGSKGVTTTGQYLPRSDAMILLSINSITNTINMVSLSRAVYVKIPEHGNFRLNAAHAFGGAGLLIQTIEDNYKIRIDNYAVVDFSGFTNIINDLNGVNIELSEKEAAEIVGKATAGVYELNGDQAMKFARLRHFDSDRVRTGRQRALLNAIADKFRKQSVSDMLGFVDDVLPLVTTNLKKTEIITKVTQAPQYLSMSVKEDIIPHDAKALTLKDGMEVLILDWDKTVSYVHGLLYPDMTPESLVQE